MIGADSLRGWPIFLIALSLVFVALYNTRYYFVTLAQDPATEWTFAYDLVQAIDFLKTLEGDNPYVYFFSGRWSYNYETRRFLLPQISGEDRSKEFGTFSLNESLDHREVVYLLMPPYENLIGEIMKKYPGGNYQELKKPDGRFVYGAYLLAN
ncbi:MAG: hypothetical protein HY664_04415 [Chloroflexi bacterium]|nr:hypothetical protein [Chloroflexota bacterium]